MVKHTQTIRRLFRVFDHFVGLGLKGLKLNTKWNLYSTHSISIPPENVFRGYRNGPLTWNGFSKHKLLSNISLKILHGGYFLFSRQFIEIFFALHSELHQKYFARYKIILLILPVLGTVLVWDDLKNLGQVHWQIAPQHPEKSNTNISTIVRYIKFDTTECNYLQNNYCIQLAISKHLYPYIFLSLQLLHAD